MENEQTHSMIRYYVGHHLLYARLYIKQADKAGARKTGKGLVKSLKILGETKIIKEIIDLTEKTNWADVDSLKMYQKNYIELMQGTNQDGY